MMRVINQERYKEASFTAWHLSDGKTFADFQEHHGILRTRPPYTEAERKQELDAVKNKLGKLYREPIKA